MKRFDVICFGELMADFTSRGQSDNLYPVFEQNPGGGGANIAVSVSRLGGKATLISKISGDLIGQALMRAMAAENVDMSGMVTDVQSKTLMAFISLGEDNERSFTFYGEHPADLCMLPEELPDVQIKDGRIFAFGGRSLSDTAMRRTTYRAIEIARQAGAKIAFDPNIRFEFWPSSQEAKTEVLRAIESCNYVKFSVDELLFLTQLTDISDAARRCLSLGPELIMVTDGAKGAFAYTEMCHAFASGRNVEVIDTTGAGDSFWGATLYQLSQKTFDGFSQQELQKALSFSCVCGAIACTAHGAVRAMPTMEAVDSFGVKPAYLSF